MVKWCGMFLGVGKRNWFPSWELLGFASESCVEGGLHEKILASKVIDVYFSQLP